MKTTNLSNPPIRWRVAVAAVLIPFVLTAFVALASLRPARQVETNQAIILVATATAAPAQPIASRALVAFWDYQQASTATPITSADIVRIIGQAVGDWRLVELVSGAHVWVRAADVPAGIVSDKPLADLTPPTEAPAAPAPIVVYVPQAPVAPDCGPRPSGDKWVCSADGRGWIMPGIEDWLATAPVAVENAPAPAPVNQEPKSARGYCGRCGWNGQRP